MDQINPTLVLITFSFIWLIKRLTQCCILEVKEQMVKIFPPKNMDCSLQVRSSQKIISWRFSTFFVFFFSDCCCVFFFLWYTLYSLRIGIMRKTCTWGPLTRHSLINSPECNPLSATFRLVSMHFFFNWN